MARSFSEPVVVDPHTTLLLEVYRTAGVIETLARQIDDEDELTSHQGQVLVAVFQHEREHLVRCSKAAIDADAEREIALAEGQGRLIAHVIQATLTDLELTATRRRPRRSESCVAGCWS